MMKLLPLTPMPEAWDESPFVSGSKSNNQHRGGFRSVLLSALFMIAGSTVVLAQGYDLTLPQQCNLSNPGTNEILTFTNTLGNANGDATLTITSSGDIGISSTSSERLDYYDENSNLIGSTGSNGNCNLDIFTYTMPLADVLAFSADGKIEITVIPAAGVNTNQCTGTIGSAAYCSLGRLQYPMVTGPNDIGVESIDSLEAFCPGTKNIVVTVRNYGTNQVNPLTVNWTFNGITQTPVTYSQTLDTIGGTGPDSVILQLGSKAFTAGNTDAIVAWTSNPNNVADTSNRNDSASVNVQPSLSGNFTIDPSGTGTTNYLTFADAVNDLNQFGVCGACTFDVKQGTYAEQVNIGAIVGSSNTNTITFRSDPNNTAAVEMVFSAPTSNSYIFLFDGSEYITVEGIHMNNTGIYGNNVRLENTVKNITIRNCRLTGNLTTNTTSNFYSNVFARGTDFENISFINDTIVGGSMGIYLFASTSVFNSGMVFEGNVIENAYYMGMYLYGNTDMRVANNTIFGSRPYSFGYGIYSYYGGENNQIVSNTFLTNGVSTWPRYGITVGQNTSTSESTRSVVANNNIHLGTPASTVFHYGLYSIGNIFTDIIYNNVALEGTQLSSRAGFITSGGLGVRVLNNNFLHYGSGYGLYTFSNSAPTCDNNNIASAGSNIGYYSTNTADLAAWKTAGGGDNTINVDSIYANLDSLRTCDTALAGKGISVSGVVLDFDGDARNPVTPNIGSDEYVASAELFTIGDTIEFCGGDELVLGSTMNDATFLWSNSATTPTITVTTEGNYSVIVNGPCATGMTDDVEVIDVNPVASFTVEEGEFIRAFVNNSEYGSTYLWDFGDGSTSTELNAWHEYAENGTYEVSLTVMNYCDTVTFSQTVGIYVGVNEIAFNTNVSIYPNPANDFINIAIGNVDDQTVQMELVDMKGQVYANRLMKITKGSVEQIDISSLSKGVYLVRLTTDNEVATRQIVVQ